MNEIDELKAKIARLEKRQTLASEELHSLANEQRHRRCGCDYAEISPEDLDEIVDILEGKNE